MVPTKGEGARCRASWADDEEERAWDARGVLAGSPCVNDDRATSISDHKSCCRQIYLLATTAHFHISSKLLLTKPVDSQVLLGFSKKTINHHHFTVEQRQTNFSSHPSQSTGTHERKCGTSVSCMGSGRAHAQGKHVATRLRHLASRLRCWSLADTRSRGRPRLKSTKLT